MKLYSYFRSSTSYRARIALNLKAIEYDYVPVDLRTGAQTGDDYGAVNVHKTVPALVTGDQTLVQSLAILDWLEETYPNPSFLPADRGAAQTCRELYYAIATEIHSLNNLATLKYLGAEFGADSEAIKAWYQTWVHRTFEPVEVRLAKMKWRSPDLPFGAPGLLEIVLVPQIYNAERWDVDMSPFPLQKKIGQYCAGLAAFEKAHPANQPDTPKGD